MSLCALLLYGALFVDDPEARLARLLAAGGRSPAEVAGCAVARDVESGRPWWVYVVESGASASDVELAAVESLCVVPAWTERLRAFCEVMQIPWREPGWCLVAYPT